MGLVPTLSGMLGCLASEHSLWKTAEGLWLVQQALVLLPNCHLHCPSELDF